MSDSIRERALAAEQAANVLILRDRSQVQCAFRMGLEVYSVAEPDAVPEVFLAARNECDAQQGLRRIGGRVSRYNGVGYWAPVRLTADYHLVPDWEGGGLIAADLAGG
jgi:hypothetical protein